jgi:hypothetical protein
MKKSDINNSNLNTTTYNIGKDFEAKQKKYEYDIIKDKHKQYYNNVEYKTQLLNIDSRFRDTIPKNIYKTNNIILPNNPVYTTRDSNQIKINIPNHTFSIGDSIIVQNVDFAYKILTNSIYFFDHYPYMIINFNNHGIPLDFENYYSDYKMSINIINDIGTNTSYGNIPINLVIGIHNITLPSIVDKTTPITPEILRVLNVSSVSELDKNYVMLQLPYSFIANSGTYYLPSDVFKLNFLNIGGIPLNYINADYPIDYSKNQGYQEIIYIDTNNIYFNVSITASSTTSNGGNHVQIMLITNTLSGFPEANSYIINLKRTFNDVVRIELVSTEFPYIDFLVKSSSPNKNNKLYWKHLDDGNYIYQVEIPEGNYDSQNLVSTISTHINNVPRINSTIQSPIYNIFTFNIDVFTQEINIIAYKNNNLPNSLSASLVEINNITYIKLTIQHYGNLVEKLDTIVISGATKIGTILDTVYINKTHTIYEVNITNQTYSVLVAPLNQITNLTTIDLTGNGGPSTIVKTKAKVSFLFDKPDTLGSVLGFKNVGQSNAITPYNTTISNFDPYIQYTNLNQVGNLDTSTKLLNLSGANFYILMYINDYECIINNSNQPTAFAKILLSGTPGDILFNTFVNYPLEFDFPISTLNELHIKFTYPDGKLVDFRNIDHSFTLRIIEKVNKPYNTGINSKDTSFYETVKDNK